MQDTTLFDRILLPAELGYDSFDKFAFRHSLLECATAIKPRLLTRLFSLYPDERILFYLDPDVEVFGPLSEAREALKSGSILVTPHHLADIEPAQMLPALRGGIFNLGFIGLARTAESLQYLSWWAHKTELLCYADPTRGLFVDQKWVDLAVSFFDLTILREPGYNVGYWNIARREIEWSDVGLIVCGRPLRFIHFSNTDSGRDIRFFRRHARNPEAIILTLRERYKQAVSELAQHLPPAKEWSYDFFHSGERIAPDVRSACRVNPLLLSNCDDPFSLSNEYFLSRVP